MSDYKHICITNRKLVTGDFLSQLKRVISEPDLAAQTPDTVILREKDLTESEYESLARQVIELCSKQGKLCVLHSFASVAKKLDYPHIHVTFQQFCELVSDEAIINDSLETGNGLSWFQTIGVSTHSVEEAVYCAEHGATYVTASHIFETDCKPGLEARGLKYLSETVQAVAKVNESRAATQQHRQLDRTKAMPMQVYALGGIHPSNEQQCIDAGARGVCMMSEYMRR